MLSKYQSLSTQKSFTFMPLTLQYQELLFFNFLNCITVHTCDYSRWSSEEEWRNTQKLSVFDQHLWIVMCCFGNISVFILTVWSTFHSCVKKPNCSWTYRALPLCFNCLGYIVFCIVLSSQSRLHIKYGHYVTKGNTDIPLPTLHTFWPHWAYLKPHVHRIQPFLVKPRRPLDCRAGASHMSHHSDHRRIEWRIKWDRDKVEDTGRGKWEKKRSKARRDRKRQMRRMKRGTRCFVIWRGQTWMDTLVS